jgi:hypothetical protein
MWNSPLVATRQSGFPSLDERLSKAKNCREIEGSHDGRPLGLEQ